MNNDQKFKTFLNLGSKEFNITVFDDNQKIIYEDKSSKKKILMSFLIRIFIRLKN